tara:strand:- start:18473 stop:19846 length:1374 start_codon:yes stop_codon:yes gene_type:complete
MITSRAFADKSYCVLGLARSGMATVEALLESGARVTAWDRRPEPCEQLAGRVTIADPMEIALEQFEAIVVSPGVPLNTHPLVPRARAVGVPVIGDIELFAQARADLPEHKVVGITGTNGKSTTTALVHHLLKTAGVPTTMGGNIGLPILGQDPLPEGGVYVLELSSYQIDLTFSLDCDVAVSLNVTPDHLDRYEGFEAYAASKARLFEMQSVGQASVLTGSDQPSRRLAKELANDPADPVELVEQLRRRPAAVAAVGGKGRKTQHSFVFQSEQANWPTLQGPHNAQNAAAAIAVGKALGLGNEVIAEGLVTYPGLPHRMERIGTYNDVLWVNDSKATNPASTAPALAAFPRVHWICGGLPKDDNLGECMAHLGNVVCAYTIGDAAEMFGRLLSPHIPVEPCEMLCEAVNRACAKAEAGDVVLFSPACASFDQFRDYEVRGNAFRELCVGTDTGSDEA